MFTKRKILILLISILIIAGTLWAFSSEREPTYSGRSLSKWLREYGKLNPEQSDIDQANDAIRHIGTNAFPYVLKWMHDDGYSGFNPENQISRTKFEKIHWLPLNLRSRLSESWVQTGVFADASMAVFWVLGPKAASAIPELSALLHDAKSTNTALRAVHALSQIGTNSLPVLWAALSDTNVITPVRRSVAVNIGYLPILSTNVGPAIPILVKCLEDNDPRVRDIAALSLGRIAKEPGLVVPALTNSLRNPTITLQQRVMYALGKFRKEARPALPSVIRTLGDPDEDVRKAATNALMKIAPEILTNTPAQ